MVGEQDQFAALPIALTQQAGHHALLLHAGIAGLTDGPVGFRCQDVAKTQPLPEFFGIFGGGRGREDGIQSFGCSTIEQWLQITTHMTEQGDDEIIVRVRRYR